MSLHASCAVIAETFTTPQPHPPSPPPWKSCCLSAYVFLPATLFLISRASAETDKVQNPKVTVCLYSAETRLFMENRPDARHSRSDQTLSTSCVFILSTVTSSYRSKRMWSHQCSFYYYIKNCYFLHYLYEVLHGTGMGGLVLVCTGPGLSIGIGRSLCVVWEMLRILSHFVHRASF